MSGCPDAFDMSTLTPEMQDDMELRAGQAVSLLASVSRDPSADTDIARLLRSPLYLALVETALITTNELHAKRAACGHDFARLVAVHTVLHYRAMAEADRLEKMFNE